MKNKLKVRELIKPSQSGVENKDVVPYCTGYSRTASSTTCNSGYSTNLWCVTKPASEDEVLL